MKSRTALGSRLPTDRHFLLRERSGEWELYIWQISIYTYFKVYELNMKNEQSPKNP